MADVGARNVSQQTPLHVAALNGHAPVCQMLIDCNAQVDVFDAGCETPLHLSSYKGHVVLCKMLVASCANVNVGNSRGLKPLHLASKFSNVVTCKALIDLQAQVDGRTRAQQTPLQLAVTDGSDRHKWQQLLASGASVHALDDRNQSALHRAAANSDPAACRMLLENHANLDACDQYNQTPLHRAGIYNNAAIAELLIAKGADYRVRTVCSAQTLTYLLVIYAYWYHFCTLIRYVDSRLDRTDNKRLPSRWPVPAAVPLKQVRAVRYRSTCSCQC